MNKWNNQKMLTGIAALLSAYAFASTFDRVQYLILVIENMRRGAAAYAPIGPDPMIWRNILTIAITILGLLAWWAIAALAWVVRGGRSKER